MLILFGSLLVLWCVLTVVTYRRRSLMIQELRFNLLWYVTAGGFVVYAADKLINDYTVNYSILLLIGLMMVIIVILGFTRYTFELKCNKECFLEVLTKLNGFEHADIVEKTDKLYIKGDGYCKMVVQTGWLRNHLTINVKMPMKYRRQVVKGLDALIQHSNVTVPLGTRWMSIGIIYLVFFLEHIFLRP